MKTLEQRIIETAAAATENRNQIDRVAAAVAADDLSQYGFRLLLTDTEADAWISLVEQARDAVAAGTADATQKAQLRAWRDFHLPPGIQINAPETQAAIYALHLWGVLTQERADRVAQGLAPAA